MTGLEHEPVELHRQRLRQLAAAEAACSLPGCGSGLVGCFRCYPANQDVSPAAGGTAVPAAAAAGEAADVSSPGAVGATRGPVGVGEARDPGSQGTPPPSPGSRDDFRCVHDSDVPCPDGPVNHGIAEGVWAIADRLEELIAVVRATLPAPSLCQQLNRDHGAALVCERREGHPGDHKDGAFTWGAGR